MSQPPDGRNPRGPGNPDSEHVCEACGIACPYTKLCLYCYGYAKGYRAGLTHGFAAGHDGKPEPVIINDPTIETEPESKEPA